MLKVLYHSQNILSIKSKEKLKTFERQEMTELVVHIVQKLEYYYVKTGDK